MMHAATNTPLPGTLARFQDAFAQALLSQEAPPHADIAALAAQPAFAIYRNTVMKGCVDALQANYPAVTRLVGAEWFRAAAANYVRAALPSEPALLRYGAGFADFLARFEPAGDLPYLPGVARLDRLWGEAHAAAEDDTLDPAAIASLAPAMLANAILHPHAAARWAWFNHAPVYTIWSRNRGASPPEGDIDWLPEGALLTRARDAVTWRGLDIAGCAFLDACAAGQPLTTAAQAALAARADADLAQLMAGLLEAGAFSSLSLPGESRNHSRPTGGPP